MFIYFWGRERQSTGGGGADTESEAGSRLWDVSTEPDVGLELTNREIMTWAEVRCLTNWATQVPQEYFKAEKTLIQYNLMWNLLIYVTTDSNKKTQNRKRLRQANLQSLRKCQVFQAYGYSSYYSLAGTLWKIFESVMYLWTTSVNGKLCSFSWT